MTFKQKGERRSPVHVIYLTAVMVCGSSTKKKVLYSRGTVQEGTNEKDRYKI